MLRMEDVRGWGVVNDDGFSQITANLREIFDIVALVVVTALPKEAVMHNVMDVKLVK
jgi:hypothetical protein